MIGVMARIGLRLLLILLLGAAILAETATATAQLFPSLAKTNNSLALRQGQTSFPCTLRAVPAKTSGRIDLSWSCTSNALKGWFLVERSIPRSAPQSIRQCWLAVGRISTYSCADTGLRKGTSYTYQLCLVSTSTANRCGTNDRAATVTVRAP
ncbi:MAG: hypothetical protein DCC55_28920 [Chloroflexi bacterium]|nr:MAG: hypothetical protein DCC55_28920 [Chloroflexota bacterium]